MSDPRFLQKGFDKQLAHLLEECGELISAGGKTLRWGPFSVNPLIPAAQQVPNVEWLQAEMLDVENCIARLRETIEKEVM